MQKLLKLTVNGREREVMVESNQTLLEVLRNGLGITSVKEGCSDGNCGSCTVLLDGKAVNSCLVLAMETEGREINTIDGLFRDGKLHPLQQAFIEEGAVQCGFCTSGMLLAAKELLETNPSPTEEEVRIAICGNLCRCTGYDKIVRAILRAAN